MNDEQEKENYFRYQQPDEFERRKALLQKGIESARLLNERKKRIIEAAARNRRRRELDAKD